MFWGWMDCFGASSLARRLEVLMFLGCHSSFLGWVTRMLLLPVSLYKIWECHALYCYTGTKQSEILPGGLCYRMGQHVSAPATVTTDLDAYYLLLVSTRPPES
jgi:hypothetical protein